MAEEILQESKINAQAIGLYERVKTFIVKSEQDYIELGAFRQQNKKLINNIKVFFAPMKKKADEAHTEICNKEKETLKTPLEVEKISSNIMNVYLNLKEKERQVEQARLEAEAKKQEEREKERWTLFF